MSKRMLVSCVAGSVLLPLVYGPAQGAEITTATAKSLETVVVTARLRKEDAQSVPVSLSVVDGDTLDKAATYNISQLTRLVPSLNYVSPNPRNTAFTIRGLGSSVVAVAQANDGLEPGVGFYVDQVYHGRPATAAFDFLDLERVEVLRGPQGTLFGKNTTAGAINISSQPPSFTSEFKGEASLGNEGYRQAKASGNGALIGDWLAGRISTSITHRDGDLRNVRTGQDVNDVNTYGVRAQLLFTPSEDFKLRFIADDNSFDATCCTQVYVRVAPTLKPLSRQYAALAAGQSYAPPSLNPYDRLTDIDAGLRVATSEGGLSAIADWMMGSATFTSVSAWRWWNWNAENDRDYTGLSIQTSQHIPSRQDQYSQEFRIASNGTHAIDYVAGLYWFGQTIRGRPITIYGPSATYWLLGSAPTFPSNLLDGYGTDGSTRFHSNSYAAFGETTWHVTDKLAATGGLRYTWEDKQGRYDSFVFGGLSTTNISLNNSKLSILRPQSYRASTSDASGSGRFVLSYNPESTVLVYASYAQGSKSGGINMSGLPLNAANQPALAAAVVKPEKNATYELGMKTNFFAKRLLLNADVYDTTVHDFQANVVDTGPGALRGYLANIEKVRIKGAEFDSIFLFASHWSGHLSAAYTDGKYVSYNNGPCPIESIGNSTTVCDLSGKRLSATPRWAESVGGEYSTPVSTHWLEGEMYLNSEAVTRSWVYGDPSDSQYTRIDGYTLVNARLGFRTSKAWDVALWARNLFNRNYLQNVTVQAGNSGLIVGTPGEERIVGLTARVTF